MTLADDLDLEEYITAKDDLSGADIKVRVEVNLRASILCIDNIVSRCRGNHNQKKMNETHQLILLP